MDTAIAKVAEFPINLVCTLGISHQVDILCSTDHLVRRERQSADQGAGGADPVQAEEHFLDLSAKAENNHSVIARIAALAPESRVKLTR